jgi:hypothetical protein
LLASRDAGKIRPRRTHVSAGPTTDTARTGDIRARACRAHVVARARGDAANKPASVAAEPTRLSRAFAQQAG